MNSDAERTLNNLHVLAALSHNDKLMTNDDLFDIYTPTSMRGIVRMWYGENRGQNVQRVRSAIRMAIGFATTSFDEVNAMLRSEGLEHDGMRLRVDTTAIQYFRMIHALTEARAGLHNLQQTYRDDAASVSQIGILMTEIDDFVNVMKNHSRSLDQRCQQVTHSLPR